MMVDVKVNVLLYLSSFEKYFFVKGHLSGFIKSSSLTSTRLPMLVMALENSITAPFKVLVNPVVSVVSRCNLSFSTKIIQTMC